MSRLTLWLFVFILGIDLGAGLYETRIVVPLWSQVAPTAIGADNPYVRTAIDAGMRFWAFVTPAVGIIAIAALVFGFRAPQPERALRLFATILQLCVIAATLGYFIPTLKGLFLHSGAGATSDATAAVIHAWVRWNYIRVAASLVAWCAALAALCA